jgi:hypothetical protein
MDTTIKRAVVPLMNNTLGELMETVNYPTGRDYGSPQILEIIYTPFSANTDDDFLIGLELTEVTFKDAVRHISGCVQVFRQDANQHRIGRAVLAEYDAGRYSPLQTA